MKETAKRIRKDIVDYKYAGIAVVVYAIVTHAYFGRFCPLAVTTGLPCPACGVTRATGLLLRGEFAAAWQMHAMIYPFVLLAIAFCFSRYVRNKSTTYLLKYVWVMIACSLIYYVVRMYLYFLYTAPLEMYEGSVLMRMLQR